MGRTILLVEDDREIADAVVEALSDDGYQVAAADDGDTALERLAAGLVPDVILLDVAMKRVDGHEFRRRQLQDRRIAGIPTYLLTAGSVDSVRARSLTGWLRKPVDLDTLLGVLDRHCRPAQPHDHLVHFYDTDETLVARVGTFLTEGLARGDAAIAIATAAHVEGFKSALASERLDVSALERRGQVLFLDAADTLARLITAGIPDRRRFEGTIGPIIDRMTTSASSGRVRAYGEMVSLLWRAGDAATAIQLEALWNELGQAKPFSLLCGYLTSGAPADPSAHREVLRVHSAVV